MRQGLNVLVDINYSHSHRVNVAQALSLLRCSDDTVKKFESYFEGGMTAAAAKSYHEMAIIEESEENAYITLSNAQKNPLDRQVTHLYEQWRLRTYGTRDLSDVVEILKRKKIEMSETNVKLFVNEDPTTCIIITPIMQRVFMAGLADEMVFIDTSGSCDQTNACVTFYICSFKNRCITDRGNFTHRPVSRKLYTLLSICKKIFTGDLREGF